MATPNNESNSVLAPYFEKFSIWAAGAAIALLCVGFQDQRATVQRLDERVQFLMLDKVSKQDMREVEERIMNRIQAGNDDIIARMDLLFRKITKQ